MLEIVFYIQYLKHCFLILMIYAVNFQYIALKKNVTSKKFYFILFIFTSNLSIFAQYFATKREHSFFLTYNFRLEQMASYHFKKSSIDFHL